jgi:5-methylthioadenosine/S-adenosylhomocysteine deaminase
VVDAFRRFTPRPLNIYVARWVLPVARPPIAGGAVAIDGDRIAYVGPRHGAPSGTSEDLGDCAILPGLVNAHTHLDLTVLRGFLDGLPFFTWIRALTAARRDVLTSADLRDSARLAIGEGLRAGVTTYADTAPGDAAFDAMLELGVRGIAYREVFGPEPARCAASMEELRDAVAGMAARETPLVRAGVSPHAPYSVSDPLYRDVARFARNERLPIATHVAESEDESLLVAGGAGPFAELLRGRRITVEPRARSPLALLEQCGVLDANPLLIHCVRADASDIAAVGRRRLGVAHCPRSNAWFGHGASPVAALLDAGARVGLGSDSLASNPAMDLFSEARMVLEATPPAGGAWRPADVLALATAGGARALGLDRHIGSLEPGMQADVAAFAVPLPNESSPERALLSSPLGPAELVMVAGRTLVRHGTVLAQDDGLMSRIGAAEQRLAAWKRTPRSEQER